MLERELSTVKGFVDIVMLLRKNVNKPAIIVELKYRGDTFNWGEL